MEIKVVKTKFLYDRKVRGADFSLKEKVWLINSERKKRKNPKLAKIWKGPFEIIEILGPVNYKIKALNGKKRIVVHRNRLKKCFMNLNLNVNDNIFVCPPSQQLSPSKNVFERQEALRIDSVPSVVIKTNTQGVCPLNPQDSIRDDFDRFS
ncbi:unnamed protein product [Brachionus calyciflorus]|uniref:Integrase p58-like C-terminal domain-containing protein n=1 Tax=Brachionus calyciflorus TaxID=104777 RepID=A0A813YMV6_9BILA|nr:unnamed protein product [Brachionus calyciflorus]